MRLTHKDRKTFLKKRANFTSNYKNLFIDNYGKKTILFLCGDFNSKVGLRQNDSDTFIGKYSRGIRNSNGQLLANFCESNNLFIINSAFRHPASHITTWTGQKKVNDKYCPIYNQIDFILCFQHQKRLFTNALSYGGTITTSDHKMVQAN